MTGSRVSNLKQKRSRLAESLPPVERTLRGSLYERFMRCGKPVCRCKQPGAPGHGPYYYLTINRGAGNTISIKVPPQMVSEVKQWAQNYKKLRRKLEEISRINLELISESKNRKRTNRSKS